MADQTSTYAIQMVDEVSGAAESAASALAKLDQQMEADTKRLAGMQKALRNLQGATTPNIAAIQKMKDAIAQQKSVIADVTAKQLALGGSFVKAAAPKGPDPRVEQMKALQDQVNQMSGLAGKLEGLTAKYDALKATTTEYKDQVKAQTSQLTAAQSALAKTETKLAVLGEKHEALKSKTGSLSEGFKSLTSQAQAMPGPLGNMAGMLSRIASVVVKNPIAAGIMAIVAALAALVAGTVAAVRSLYNYGVAQADAMRSERLRLEGLTKMRFLFQRIPGDATKMQDAIDQVAAKTPLARAEIVKYNEQLYRMGLRGDALTKTLEAVAIKSAVQGDEAANAFAGWAAGASLAGRGVDKLADHVKAKLGGIAAQQMKSLTVQTMKQQEAQEMLFSGLDIEAWLGAWKDVRDLMSQATATGRALKFLISTLLQPLIGASTEAAPVVKRFFQIATYSVLTLFVAVLKLRNWWRKTFGEMDTATLAAMIGLIGTLTSVIIALAIKGVMLLAAKLWLLVPAIWAAIAPILPFVVAFLAVGAAIFQLIRYWDELVIAFQQVDWGEFGKDLIMGIVKALVPGPIVDAMTTLGGAAIKAFKSVIGSASPAKVFIRVGKTIPEGVAEGVDQGAPDAQAATERMLRDTGAPELGSGAAASAAARGTREAGAAAGARAGATINIAAINVNGSDAKQMAVDFRRELERVLEGFAFELGAREVGA